MIDLGNRSCSHLLFKGLTTLSEPVLENIRSEFDIDLNHKRRWNFEEKAVSNQWVEYVQVSFEKQLRSKPALYEVEFHYDASKPKRKPRNVSQGHCKSAKVLEILSTLGASVDFECDVAFEYASPSAQRFFPFHVDISNNEERAFDEIRGVTMVKLEQGELLYTVTLESPDLEELSLHVASAYTAGFSKNLPEEVFQEALMIKSKFL